MQYIILSVRMRGKLSKINVLAITAALAAVLLTPPGHTQDSASQQDFRQASTGALRQYCVTCHNPTLKTAGLVLDRGAVAQVGNNAELWEKVIRQLRSKTMPPPGMPRPDPATYEKVASYLETELDRAATANPNPGEMPNLRRLTRTEYQNSIRDLLALDNLPKEMDFTLLLPADNASSGFDNIADLLYISPAIMERYLDAARKISRLAVGDPSTPVMVNIHRLPLGEPQDTRVEDLPFGTRGGVAVHSYFPLDGEYDIEMETSGGAGEPHQLEISVDGERKQLIAVGGAGRGGRGGRQGPAQYRVQVKAGPRLIGVAFVQRTEALDEATLHPRVRTRGTQPAIAAVTIRGPYNASGSGDTPSRQRIFTCSPQGAADETTCAKQ